MSAMIYSGRRFADQRATGVVVAGAAISAIFCSTVSIFPILIQPSVPSEPAFDESSTDLTSQTPPVDAAERSAGTGRGSDDPASTVHVGENDIAVPPRKLSARQETESGKSLEKQAKVSFNVDAANDRLLAPTLDSNVTSLADPERDGSVSMVHSSDRLSHSASTAQSGSPVAEKPETEQDFALASHSAPTGRSDPLLSNISHKMEELENGRFLTLLRSENFEFEIGEGANIDSSPIPPPSSASAIFEKRWVSSIKPNERRAYIDQVSKLPPDAQIAQIEIRDASSQMVLRHGGRSIATVAFQVDEASRISVSIGQVLDAFKDRFDVERFAYLRGSRASDMFVTLEWLREAGVPISYDPVYDELILPEYTG